MASIPFDRRPVDDPAELGIDPAALDALIQRAQQEVDAGRLLSCQLALARDGRLAAWRTLGAAAPESRYVIFSCTKALVAGAVWVLMGEGLLDASRRVAEIVPEFATNGKDVITVEQVLLHTSGFPYAPFRPGDWDDRERRLARFAQWRCNWEPGTRFEYHPTSAHWVLAELIERCTGTDFRTFVRDRILTPLGLTGLRLGIPVEQQGDINALVATGEEATADELEAALGVRALPQTEVTREFLLAFNEPSLRAVGVPGGGAVSTAADLALYYQALLHNPGAIWKPDVLADVTSRVRNTFLDQYGVPANRTLGLVVAGDDGRSHARGMGRTVSARAFGHDGAGGQIAWADPATGLSFCFLTNGLDQHQLREWRRTTAIASRAANCVSVIG
jgi:CubicO group peptidase (beta-lactamase class C family)